MNQRNPVIEGRELVDMRLMALLRELERGHGRRKAAAILGVDRRTLDAGVDEGVLSRRMRGALDRALRSGVGSAAAEERDGNEELEGRLQAVEDGHEKLAKELRRRLGVIERGVEDLRRDVAQGTGAGHAGAGPSQAEAGAPAGGRRPPPKPRMRREYPDLVTLEPAEDDEAVFGDAWPLIVEWRELKDRHPHQGNGLAWLAEGERLRVVELALLEEHGMTLPPEKQPLRGLDRSGQITWRRAALSDTRRERKKAELLNRVTFGLWWG